MYPLVICSLVAIAIVVERAVFLRRSRLMSSNVVEEVQSQIEKGDFDGAINRNRYCPILVGRILSRALEEYAYTSADIETSLLESGERQLQVLNNNMSILSLVAKIAPLLGLLGTVVGMIAGFEQLSYTGVGKEQLAAAIGVALITTATGLTIAIPTLVAITYFRSRIRRLQAEFEEIFIDIVKTVKSQPSALDKETNPAQAAPTADDHLPGRRAPEEAPTS